ncbi:flagellar FliJ protein [Oikeobacillus pervagus]|uniref:Flagellar FliJ protein n=1 Tax=Oikeobacillus pervagus TaxID=1325931 RepID=A0AAJ1SX00_9BACI|nr:flagellar export protein FliJ [Oikeobacillus pervagus]MDQ0214300.1 flagellar FliJ protein [Oikeobacillus pervagus]
MNYHFKFDKILHLKEREKDEVLATYNESLKQFEEVAEKLYFLLKKKEDLLQYQENQLVSGFSIIEIQHHQQFISNLEKTIDYHQQLVINARNKMNWFSQLLQEKNIEVKKYEKIKEKDMKRFKAFLLQNENKQMDEISTIQFMNRGN